MKNSDDILSLDQALEIYVTEAVYSASTRRQVINSNSTNLITAILREINETILPRRLVFSTAADETLCFDVAGRRILGCVDLTSGVEIGIMVAPDDQFSEYDVDRIIDLLRDFTARHDMLGVRSIIAGGSKLSSSGGVSATIIIKQLELVATKPQESLSLEKLTQYIHRLGPIAKTYIILEAGLKLQSLGNTTNLVRLKNDFLNTSIQAKGDNNQMVLLQEKGTIGNRRDFLFAECGSHQLLMEFESEDPIVLIETWLSVKTMSYEKGFTQMDIPISQHNY